MKTKQLLLTMLALFASITVSAMDFEVDGIRYSTTEGGVTVTGYNSNATDLVLNGTVTYEGTTYNVVSIGDNAFNGCNSLTSVGDLSACTSIGTGAFVGCSNLTSVGDLSALTGMGDAAFNSCSNLTSIDLNACPCIASWAFAGCSSLTSVTLNACSNIGHWAFAGCSGLTSVTLGDSMQGIGDCAFADCSSLTSLTFLGTMPIGGLDFGGCDNLTNIYINGLIFPGHGLSAHLDWIFPSQANIIVGPNGGWLSAYMPPEVMDFMNTDENMFTKESQQTITFPLRLEKINVGISQIQFDITVYNGFTLEKVEMDKTCFNYDPDLGYTHSMQRSLIEDNEERKTYRILLNSPDNTCINLPITNEGRQMEDGALLYFTISGSPNEEGEIGMFSIGNFEFATPNAVASHPTGYYKPIKAFMRDIGDFNKDERFSVSDYASIIRWILGERDFGQEVPEWVLEKAADVNQDGTISVADVSGIVNLILYGNYNGPAKSARHAPTNAAEKTSIYMEPFTIQPGEAKEVSVDLSSIYNDLSQCQFDIILPEGLSIESINGRIATLPGELTSATGEGGHSVVSVQREDGSVRVLCLSNSNEAFSSNSGSIVKIKLTAADDMEHGEYSIALSNVEFARTNAATVIGSGRFSTISVGSEVTSINTYTTERETKSVYRADGTLQKNMTKGLNIVRNANGNVRKVSVK